MGYESETDTFFYLSGIEGEDLSFMSFSYYPQDTQKDCNYLGKVRINLLPLPDSDFTLILPSCKVIICLHKLSPIPEPDVLVVKKGTIIKNIGQNTFPIVRYCQKLIASRRNYYFYPNILIRLPTTGFTGIFQ